MIEPPHLEPPVLGLTQGIVRLERTRAIRDVSAEMTAQARRELIIFGQTLDPALYDHPPFLSAVRTLALARPDVSVRVMVRDPRTATQAGHRLIELARRLSSRIAIRRIGEDDKDRLDAFLVADERGYVRRRLADTMEATADFNDSLEARQLRSDFNQLWERGCVDGELRRLFI